MLKKFIKRVQINFRQSHSDRSATNSYRNYHQQVGKFFQKANIFNKLRKKDNYDKS